MPEAEIEFVGTCSDPVLAQALNSGSPFATEADLDDCGPIPFLEAKMRQPDPETTDASIRLRSINDHDRKRWLYLTQMGDDDVECLSAADSTSDVELTYEFGDYVVIQCATYGENVADNDQ